MPVHDIDVEHLNASGFDTANVFTQTCEIGGEYGWKNLKHSTTINVAIRSTTATRISCTALPGTLTMVSRINYLDRNSTRLDTTSTGTLVCLPARLVRTMSSLREAADAPVAAKPLILRVVGVLSTIVKGLLA